MKLNLNNQAVDLTKVEYGDIVVCDNNKSYLIMADYDGTDYVGVDLLANKVTDCRAILNNLFTCEIVAKPIQIIKAENLVMGVC